MPAQSQQQQKLFGLALSVKRGETPRSEASSELLDIVDSMTEKQIEDFASTSHSGLPSKVEAKLRELVRDSIKAQGISVMENTLKEGLYQDIMRGVKKGDSPFTLVVIKNNKVVKQVEVKTGQAIPANYSSLLKEFPNSIIRIEDATGKIVMGESATAFKTSGKKIFSDAKGKLFFGYQTDDDTVQLVDYKTWKKLSMKDLSNEFMANRVINTIVRNERQLNKKVEYNMWSKKTNPSFEDRMDYFIKNNWISNITKTGIKESVEYVNEENEPTNPELWDRAIAAAKREYDVYPSAYANAFASKWYKDKGGDWKTKNESVNEVQVADFKIGDFIHLTRLNKTGMVTKISGDKVTIRTPQRFITGDIKDVEVLYQDGVIPSVTEAISRDAAYIHGILQTGQDAAQNFIDDNGLDGEKLSDYVKANRNNIDGYNVKHYISGERGTVGSVPKLRQAFIKKFKKGKSVKETSVNESSVEIGDIVFFPSANSAATVVDRFGRSVTLKLANGKKVKTVVDKVKLLAQDNVNEGNAFTGALFKARQEGLTEFEFNGKKYPVQKLEEKEKEETLAESKLTKNSLKQIIKEEYHNVKTFMEEKYGFTPELGKVYSNLAAKPFLKEEEEEILDEYDVENYQDLKEFVQFMTEYKSDINEAEYQGRKVKLGKIMQGDVKKFKVYVKNDKGNVVKVNFGQGGDAKGGTMRIRKDNPEARKSFRARHNCDTPGPRWKARYWSCRKW